MKVTVLGCGSSGGVPVLGCECNVCISSNPRNMRSRASVLLHAGGKQLLIDTSPDLRTQCLRHRITQVDAILYTHAHADHLHGIDDVRSLNYHRNGAIDIHADANTMEEITRRFSYIFTPRKTNYGWYKPALTPQTILLNEGIGRFQVAGGPEITAFEQQHGDIRTLGFRLDNFAYSTDVNRLPESAFSALQGVEVWIVDCLRRDPSPTHAHLDLALEWIRRIKPRRAILTHMSHEFDYEALRAALPEGVEPAYDGMCVEL